VGPNGAGKTTTVEILVCLRGLTAGKAAVLGFDVASRKGQQQLFYLLYFGRKKGGR
jgi:ABC-2 type transport system ATP-binding protein